MKKEYCVAGHTFRVVLPDGHPLWDRMRQYDPFVCSSEEAPLFELELTEKLPDFQSELYFDQPTEPGETKITIYRSGEQWYFESSVTSEVPVSMKLLMSADFRKSILEISDSRFGLFALNNALMMQYAFCTVPYSTLEMHASVIAHNGRAYLFTARSGTGKSTQSRMWLESVEGAKLLNDDNPIVRVLENGEVRVYGSPWSGKTHCYINENYPAGAFVQIVRAPHNKAVALPRLMGYANIYSATSGIKFDEPMGDAIHDTISRIVASVKCFALECLPNAEAAQVCREAVEK